MSSETSQETINNNKKISYISISQQQIYRNPNLKNTTIYNSLKN